MALIQDLKEIEAEHPDAWIEPDYDPYAECPTYGVYYYREETDTEYTKRIAAAKKEREWRAKVEAAKEEKERKLLEELKRKYEK